MRKRGRKFTAARTQVASDRSYSIEEAIPLVQKIKFAKFDETVEMALRLGVDPKHADQMVRGTVVLPHGLGRTKRVTRGGIADVRNNLAAYTVVRAETQEEAAKLFVDHPHFTIFPGDGVEIMEVLPIPAQ